MEKPKTTIHNEFVAISTPALKAQCTTDRFIAEVGRRQIDVSREKISDSDDLFIGLLHGLAIIIELQTEGKI